jgi:leader peptidase (prepilin peptidase)/N-methyltransferase
LEQNILVGFSAAFGLLVGSFLNALIYRLPREINIALPRSHCPECKKLIYWYENIPVLSFLFLRGKCSGCGATISWQYPLVELFTGIVAAIIAPTYFSASALFSFLFLFGVFCAFLVHFIVDLKHQILPDSINIYLACLFFMVSLVNRHWSYWLAGAAIGIGFPYIVSWIFYKLRGQIGLGGGDIKLYGALGLYLGPLGIIQNIFLSCFLGAVVGVALMMAKVLKRENPIPFGPFIIVVGFVQIFFEKWFEHWVRYIS